MTSGQHQNSRGNTRHRWQQHGRQRQLRTRGRRPVHRRREDGERPAPTFTRQHATSTATARYSTLMGATGLSATTTNAGSSGIWSTGLQGIWRGQATPNEVTGLRTTTATATDAQNNDTRAMALSPATATRCRRVSSMKYGTAGRARRVCEYPRALYAMRSCCGEFLSLPQPQTVVFRLCFEAEVVPGPASRF